MFYRCRQFIIERPAAFTLLVGATLLAWTILLEYSYELANARMVLRPDAFPSLAVEWVRELRAAHREIWYEAMVWITIGAGAMIFAVGAVLALACRRLGIRVC